MSRKKKDEEGSSHFLTALIGIGIGAIGGFLLNKFVNSEGSQEAPRQARQAPIQVEPERRSARQNDSKIGTTDETLQEMMLCPIGLVVMKEPMTIPQCGHSFEKQTIYLCLTKKSECPLCRKETTVQSLVPNYQLKNIIDHYKQTHK